MDRICPVKGQTSRNSQRVGHLKKCAEEKKVQNINKPQATQPPPQTKKTKNKKKQTKKKNR